LFRFFQYLSLLLLSQLALVKKNRLGWRPVGFSIAPLRPGENSMPLNF